MIYYALGPFLAIRIVVFKSISQQSHALDLDRQRYMDGLTKCSVSALLFIIAELYLPSQSQPAKKKWTMMVKDQVIIALSMNCVIPSEKK